MLFQVNIFSRVWEEELGRGEIWCGRTRVLSILSRSTIGELSV